MKDENKSTDQAFERLFEEAATAFPPPAGMKEAIRRRLAEDMAAPAASQAGRPTSVLPMAPRRVRRIVWIGAAAAVLALGLVAAWQWWPQPPEPLQVAVTGTGAANIEPVPPALPAIPSAPPMPLPAVPSMPPERPAPPPPVPPAPAAPAPPEVSPAGEHPDAPAADEATIKKLVADLGAKEAAVREAAQKRLIEFGFASRPALLVAAKSNDPEVRTRALAALKATVEVTIKDLGVLAVGDGSRDWFKSGPPHGEDDSYSVFWLGDPLPGGVSPNGEHVACFIRKDGGLALVLDGKEGPKWDDARHLGRPAQDGSLTYWAGKDKKGYIVTVGQEEKAIRMPTLDLPDPVQSSDGKHLAYRVKTADGLWAVVRDGHEGPHFPSVTDPTFAPAGDSLAYLTRDMDKHQFVMIDGKRLGPYAFVMQPVVFSPDGKRLAFIAGSAIGGQIVNVFAVCDGKECPAYSNVEYLTFSPDSRGLAYVATAPDDRTRRVLWDHKEVGQTTAAWFPMAFSADGRRLAWSGEDKVSIYDRDAKEAKDATVVLSAPGVSRACHLAVTPDGRHVGYATAIGRLWVAFVDGRRLPGEYPFEEFTPVPFHHPAAPPSTISPPLVFSADGRHVFFRGLKGPTNDGGYKFFMVIDGLAQPEHDEVCIPEDFKSWPKHLRYIVRDGQHLRLVEAAWPEEMTWEKAVGASGK